MGKRDNIIFFLGLVIPAIFVFKSLFLPGSLAAGDAPYFYREELRELASEPYAWTTREGNFGQINKSLWLSPLLILYGMLGKYGGLGNDLIVRIIFYFPSVLLAGAGSILLTKYLKYPKKVSFFASFIYVFNTYYLLLIDGGQVGVALAYGIFPMALLFLKKLVDRPGYFSFLPAVITTLALSFADVRITAICFMTIILWLGLETATLKPANVSRKLIFLFELFIFTLALVAYAWVPIVRLGYSSKTFESFGLQLISLLNPLFLFQPHWPGNIFGKVSPVPFYFIGIPILIFGGLLLVSRGSLGKKARALTFALMFLVFAFLAKGDTPPLGSLYGWVAENIPFGLAFRDSSKFFIPLLLFAGILMGNTVDILISFRRFRKGTLLRSTILFVVYGYLLFLILPALTGKLNFVLSSRVHSGDFQLIKEQLVEQPGPFRTVWFPERHPLTFETGEKPALDAKGLVNERPFSDMNVGTYDVFNFIHNEKFLDWFRLLGIKYLIFSGDPRVVDLSEEQQENWDDLLRRTATASGLVRIDWATDIPIYEVPEVMPRMFGVEKLAAVVGGRFDSAQGKLPYPAIYFEDGKLDPRVLEGIASESASLVFNGKDETDLAMSFLQDYFIGPAETQKSDWSVYAPSDYLTWKYQLLIRDLETRELDYGRGVAFSTRAKETLVFNLEAESGGEYILAVRNMVAPGTSPLEFEFNDVRGSIPVGKGGFGWFEERVSLKKAKYELTLENNTGGLYVVNTVALIPKDNWDEAKRLAQTFIKNFGVIELDELDSFISASDESKVDFEKISPVRYKMSIPKSANWVIFTDSYHPKWKLKMGNLFRGGVPLYSIANGFNVGDDRTSIEIVFEGQKEVRRGIYFSVISILALAIIFLRFYSKER